MELSAKIRFGVFIILVVMMCASSVAYADEAYGVLHPDKVYSEHNGEINIDGSDFTGIFDIISSMFYGIVNIVVVGIYMIIMIVANAIGFVLLRLLSINKKAVVLEKEVKYTTRIIWISTMTSFVLSIFMTNITFSLCAAFLFWQMPLFAYCIYVYPLKKLKEQSN